MHCTICTIGDERAKSAESAKQKIECDRLTVLSVWRVKRSNGQKGQGEYSIKMTHDKENYKITGLYYV